MAGRSVGGWRQCFAGGASGVFRVMALFRGRMALGRGLDGAGPVVHVWGGPGSGAGADGGTLACSVACLIN